MHELLYPELSYPWAGDFNVGNSETISALIISAVREGKRPSMPNDENKDHNVYKDLIRRCWNQDPKSRPFALDLVTEIKALPVYQLNFFQSI